MSDAGAPPGERFRTGLARFRQRDFSGAIQLWTALLDEGYDHAHLELYLAVARREQTRVLALAESYGDELGAADSLPPVRPVEAPLARARRLIRDKRLVEARTCLEEALTVPGKSPFPTLLALAQVELMLGHLQDALFHLEEARLVEPDSSLLHASFGAALKELGRSAEAEKSYRRAVALDDVNAPAWVGLARLYVESDRLDAAEPCLKKVLALRPGNMVATELLDEVRRRQEENRNLIAEALEVLATHPRYPDWHHRVAVYFTYAGDYAKAREHLLQALDINPRMAKSSYQLALIEAREGRFESACSWFRKCLDSGRTAPGTDAGLAARLEAAGNLEEAAWEYAASVQPQENRASQAIDMGKRLFAEGFLPQARHELETALGLEAGYPDAHFVLGRVALEEGKLAEARERFGRALELSPRYQHAALGLARVALKLGEAAEARRLHGVHAGAATRPDIKAGWAALADDLAARG